MSAACPELAPHGRTWADVADLGRIREYARRSKRRGTVAHWRIDFYPALKGSERFLYGDEGRQFQSQEHAAFVLSQIRARVMRGMPPRDAIGISRAPTARPNLLCTRAATWLAECREQGELEPNTLEGYASVVNNHLGFWDGRAVAEVSYFTLSEWRDELRARGYSGRTIRNHSFAVMRAFLRWYTRHEPTFRIPEFPRVKLEQRKAAAMPLLELAKAIHAVPVEDRGIFLANVYTLRRPNEIRAVQVGDYNRETGVLWIGAAMPTKSGRVERRESTKTGDVGEYELAADARAWIEEQTPAERWVNPTAPLFPNPRTGEPYRMGKLQALWRDACTAAEVAYVPLYRAMKHSPGTALVEDGVSLGDVQNAMGHTSGRTTALYVVEKRKRVARATARLETLLKGG